MAKQSSGPWIAGRRCVRPAHGQAHPARAAPPGYLLALIGDIVTMPGLPRVPAAFGIDLDASGEVTGVT
jgi:formate--tetrahydrofolate ligase